MIANLFVYGTLRSGVNNRYADLLRASATLLGHGAIQGRLYRVAEYPGFIPSGIPHERVHGDVYSLEEADEIWSVLDEYEGPDFARTSVTALMDDGTKVDATAYSYRGGVAESQRIETGDFLLKT